MRSPNHRVVRTDGTRACYEIHNTDHTLAARHIRIDLAKGKKTFTWELPDGTKGLGGRAAKTLPLYRSETLRALKPGAMVIVTEGEKATDAAVALEFDAVGTVTGSSSLPNDAVLRTLDGFHVIAWPDADVVGHKHMDRLLAACARLRDGGAGAGLSLVDPARLGLTGKGDDAADWTPTDDALDELFDAIRPWSPPPSEPAPPLDDEPPLPDPEDDSEQPTGHLIPEGKTRAGLIKALEWVWIDVRRVPLCGHPVFLELVQSPASRVHRRRDGYQRRGVGVHQCRAAAGGGHAGPYPAARRHVSSTAGSSMHDGRPPSRRGRRRSAGVANGPDRVKSRRQECLGSISQRRVTTAFSKMRHGTHIR